VLVVHQNRGLEEHTRDIARRFAKEGYIGCAVDLLSREGGTDKIADQAQIPALLSNAPMERHVADFRSGIAYYSSQPIARASGLAMTGFCFGGSVAWLTATKAPELKAVAPWYGGAPPTSEVPNIKAAMLGIYSSDPQDFANRGKEELEAALKQANVTYQLKSYPNTQHAFNDDTGPRYVQDQALAAWKDLLDWFGRYVKASA
jgi:carboxymethylenebutenolidase